MSAEREDTEDVVRTLLCLAEIPIPEEEIGKMAEMYRGAEQARATIRAAKLGETEPVIVFAPEANNE
jgi:hypothetical protein